MFPSQTPAGMSLEDLTGTPGQAARRSGRQVHRRFVRLVGRLPFQGREGTRRLIRRCHDASGPLERAQAWRGLRHAMIMNVVRHVVPTGVGALSTAGYVELYTVQPRVLVGVVGAVTGLLTVVSAVVSYAQASVHVTLGRQLWALRGAADPRAGACAVPRSPTLSEEGRPAGARSIPPVDRTVTGTLVVLALVTVPPGVLLWMVPALGTGRP